MSIHPFSQQLPFNTDAVVDDVYAHVGRQILTDAHFKPPITVPPGPTGPPSADSLNTDSRQPAPNPWLEVNANLSLGRTITMQHPVGILGGGAAGLYAALILDACDIPYRIIEAQGHVGGRLFTYHFPNTTGSPYNYFDVGAMRFPIIPMMKHLWALIIYLGLEDRMKTYYFNAKDGNAFLSYNNRTYRQNDIPHGDAFDAKGLIGNLDDWQAYVKAGPQAIYDDVIQPYALGLYIDLITGSKVGWERLLAKDKYSTRAYMCTEYRPRNKKLGLPNKPLSTEVINWMENFVGSSGSFDRGFTQSVLGALAFGWTPKLEVNGEGEVCFLSDSDVQWRLFDGGSQELAKAMEKRILNRHPNQSPFLFNQRVTRISKVKSDMEVITVNTTSGAVTTHHFSHVITTLPLPVLRSLDLSGAGLNTKQSNALRQLSYTASIKIGMQFKTAWWTTKLQIVGGQSFTDKPVRRVVYPSYGKAEEGLTTTLIASYTLLEDAERMSALTIHGGNGRSAEPILIDMVLRDLVAVHDQSVTMDFLKEQLIDTFAWSWGNNPYSMGAFAEFTPGKYGDLFDSLTVPAAGDRLHFAGEAVSMVHGWVEGALDSAWRAVAELAPFLGEDFFGRFAQDWPVRAEWLSLEQLAGLPEDHVPKHRAELLKNGLLYKHILLSEQELGKMAT